MARSLIFGVAMFGLGFVSNSLFAYGCGVYEKMSYDAWCAGFCTEHGGWLARGATRADQGPWKNVCACKDGASREGRPELGEQGAAQAS